MIDKNHTLPIDLQPQSIDDKEHHASVFILNLYTIENNNGNESEEMFQNENIETGHTGADCMHDQPLTTTEHHLAVENDKKEKEYLLIGKLKDEDYEVDEINHNDKTKMLKLKSNKKEARNMMEASLNTVGIQVMDVLVAEVINVPFLVAVIIFLVVANIVGIRRVCFITVCIMRTRNSDTVSELLPLMMQTAMFAKHQHKAELQRGIHPEETHPDCINGRESLKTGRYT
ncbi:hypothetical protein EAI_00743 [Harpegnathos saltator]|uniref:Uncharacterized protein n=1 Tax=Harpegnathos saltator TaxID=610380 RepID=E2BHG8_HARSA|nr:hypothetical protein EAI_00743 [Harpegnathos saltator]